MKITYDRELKSINNWVQGIKSAYRTTGVSPIASGISEQITNDLCLIATDIQSEYPFYAKELFRISSVLFIAVTPAFTWMNLNMIAFGELSIIVKHIIEEPVNTRFWNEIHPRIVRVSKDRFLDGYYSDASERAIKEVETRMRELFLEGRPSDTPPKDAAGLIGALLSDHGIYSFCDTSDISGKNFRTGTKSIFEGVFLAYRNPAMHANLDCTPREAFERIVQASQMMYILTNGEVKK